MRIVSAAIAATYLLTFPAFAKAESHSFAKEQYQYSTRGRRQQEGLDRTTQSDRHLDLYPKPYRPGDADEWANQEPPSREAVNQQHGCYGDEPGWCPPEERGAAESTLQGGGR